MSNLEKLRYFLTIFFVYLIVFFLDHRVVSEETITGSATNGTTADILTENPDRVPDLAYHIVPLGPRLLELLPLHPRLHSVDLILPDGRHLRSNVLDVKYDPITSDLSPTNATITLPGNYSIDISMGGVMVFKLGVLLLNSTQGNSDESFIDSAPPGLEIRQMTTSNLCPGGNCGSVRVEFPRNRNYYDCTYRTGIYGGYNPCDTPASLASPGVRPSAFNNGDFDSLRGRNGLF